MSRVGKLPITIPSGVDVSVEGHHIKVKGPKGELERDITPVLTVVTEDGQLRVERPDEEKRSRELHGLTRTLINNMVVGVTEGYTRNLEIQGVGYRAQLVGKKPVIKMIGIYDLGDVRDTGLVFHVTLVRRNIAKLREGIRAIALDETVHHDLLEWWSLGQEHTPQYGIECPGPYDVMCLGSK